MRNEVPSPKRTELIDGVMSFLIGKFIKLKRKPKAHSEVTKDCQALLSHSSYESEE